MKIKQLLLLLFIATCSQLAYTQSPYFHYFTDSILPGYRISGGLDSTDRYCSPYASNTPNLFQPALRNGAFGQFSQLPQVAIPRRFSAIPHIGFSYSMGSNIQQLGKISYTQALDSINYLQLDYQRQTSNGAMRNQEYKRNQFELSWLRLGEHHALAMDLRYLSVENGLNGGLLGDTMEEGFALIFQDVNKANASQKYTVMNWEVQNYFSFTKSQSLKTGLYVHPRLNVVNRRYFETDTLPQIYGFTNYDTIFTQDFWQRGEAGGKAGYFIHTKPFVFNAGIDVAFWDYDNGQVHNDTLEISLNGDLIVNLKSGWLWKNTATANIIGAQGSFNATSILSKRFSFGSVNINGNAGRRYPQNYQRAYYGNTIDYSWTNKTLETYLDADGAVRIKLKQQEAKLSGGISQRFNTPLFLNNVWRQDTLTSLSLIRVGGGFDLRWGKLLFQPRVDLQYASVTNFPAATIQARIAYNGTIFKAKKLRNVTGIDIAYTSTYALMGYVPMMDTYVFTANTTNYTEMPKLHFFSQFDLGFFRWFIRVENIEQAFRTTTNMEAVGYPVLPMQFRFGVSWDLFN